MSDPIHSIDIEGVGTVRFRSLGRREIEALRNRAAKSGIPVEATEDQVFDAYLISEAVVSPQLSNEEFQSTFAGRADLVIEIAQAIRDRSWPNR